MDPWGDANFGALGATFAGASGKTGKTEDIELIGPHLRVSGTVYLGRFARLSDLLNTSQGYLRLFDARLLRRNGDPTSLVTPELMVNQDEVTLIGQAEHTLAELPEDEDESLLTGDRPTIERHPRRFVVFTPGHAITGLIYVHREMTLENFVDATDPRFVAMTSVSARSLADRRVVSHFAFLLVNRTQITAIAETERGGTVAEDVAEAPSS